MPATVVFSGPHGTIEIVPTAGRSSITPASRLCASALFANPHLLQGRGIDWGTGSGVLAIIAARTAERVIGIDIRHEEITTARKNAERNGVAERTAFLAADGFVPLPGEDPTPLSELAGRTDFLIANPPASSGDDGLGWRRRVLEGATGYLKPGATILLQVSRQYGPTRIAGLAGTSYTDRGLLATSGPVPFDLDRPDLRAALDDYVAEEERTGIPYPFIDPAGGSPLDATTARRRWETDRISPLSEWQVHRFEFRDA